MQLGLQLFCEILFVDSRRWRDDLLLRMMMVKIKFVCFDTELRLQYFSDVSHACGVCLRRTLNDIESYDDKCHREEIVFFPCLIFERFLQKS